MEQQIDKLVAAIRITLSRPVPPDPVLAAFMAATGIDGRGLARPQIATLVAWSTDPTLTEVERTHAAAQLLGLGPTHSRESRGECCRCVVCAIQAN